MPMVLRSRKSIHPSQAAEVESELRDTAPVTPRRSARPYGKITESVTYEQSDESDSEPVQSQVMEKHQGVPAELEEEAAEEADLTELKHCSVLLDRLPADDKATKKALEEKEDMNRKGGKHGSRIPTFHKRPSSASQNTEPPALRKDTPVHVPQPSQKAGSGRVETSKSKLPDVKETTLPLPSIRSPKVCFETSSPFSSTEQVGASAAASNSSQVTVPRSWTLSGSEQYMTASPRPALRPEQISEQHLPELDMSKTLEIEGATTFDAVSHLPCMDLLSQRPEEDGSEKCVVDNESRIPPTPSHTDKWESEEIANTTEVCHVDAIMDEEPPWARELINTHELKDSQSSSDAECEEELAGEKPEGHDSEQVDDHCRSDISKLKFSNPTEEQGSVNELPCRSAQKSVTAHTSKSAKSSGCSSFVFCFLLPTTLLLLGGFGQHVWHYGLPMSVAQLTAQLELHWLEGFGLIPEPCSTDCRVNLVETIPVGLDTSFSSSRPSIADSWLHLLNKANSSVHIATFHVTLQDSDLKSTDSQGRQVVEHLKQLESRGVNLQIAVNAQDTAELGITGAEVREIDLKAVTGGIFHTKLWVVDQKHFYLGSADMDWRSLSQVKEVGLSVEDCSCLAQDVYRIFGVYWSIGGGNSSYLPPYWPARLSALSSSQNPLHLKFNGVPARVYLSSSPPQISARGRSDALYTILSVINDAQRFVYISVTEYLPLNQDASEGPFRLWSPIDSALQAAGCTRGVQVRLMVSCWKQSPAHMFTFLQSLLVLSRPPLNCDIRVKVFTVPSTQEQMKIPLTRVNHAKFMVTDRVVYIGTSDWTEKYFTQTAGVGLVVNQTGSEVGRDQQSLQSQAEELFLRDWTSQYASTLSVDDTDVCPRQ